MQITTAPSRTSAAGQYLGFALQPVRLCFHLLRSSEDSKVSLEHVDDVTVHHPDGSQTLEQVKSALKQNPVADWADDLWKAFADWLDMIENGQANVDRDKFRIYVTPPRSGKLVELLSNANSDEAVDDVIRVLRSDLDSLPRRPRCFRYIKKLLDANLIRRRKLIRSFRLESVHDDPVDAIRDRLRSVVSTAMVDACCVHAIGNAKEQVDRLIRTGRQPVIDAGPFQATFKAFVRRNDLSGLLLSIAGPPAGSLVSQTLAGAPVFVKQLDLIDAPMETKLRAVSDFLQSSSDKTLWAERGEVTRESFAECDNDLIRQHHFIEQELQDSDAARDPKACGRTLYYRCMRLSALLEGREPPGHFVPGSFAALSDGLKVGWHRDYRRLVEVDEE